MNTNHEPRLRAWLAARDPGDAPASLRAAAARVPYETRRPAFPALDAAITRSFGPARWVRLVLVLLVVLALLAAAAGAALVQPWRPFPPRGLVAFTARIAAAGSTGISLIEANGTGLHQVSALEVNVFDHSPRWSRDGRTLLFARTTKLDPLGACGGIGSVVLYDVAAGTERVVATGLRPIDAIEWSPAGDRAAYLYPPPGCGAPAELGVVDLATGRVTTSPVTTDPVVAGTWQVRWTGDEASAVLAAQVSQVGRDFTTRVDVASHDGGSLVRYAWSTPQRIPTLEVVAGVGDAPVALGTGGMPAWSPDDTAIAFIRPGGSAGPNLIDLLRHRLSVVSVGTWETRFLADVLLPDALPLTDLPTLSWTSDGGALYWTDGNGTHVVDVVTGRAAVLAGIPADCDDLQWQPLP